MSGGCTDYLILFLRVECMIDLRVECAACCGGGVEWTIQGISLVYWLRGECMACYKKKEVVQGSDKRLSPHRYAPLSEDCSLRKKESS